MDPGTIRQKSKTFSRKVSHKCEDLLEMLSYSFLCKSSDDLMVDDANDGEKEE